MFVPPPPWLFDFVNLISLDRQINQYWEGLIRATFWNENSKLAASTFEPFSVKSAFDGHNGNGAADDDLLYQSSK